MMPPKLQMRRRDKNVPEFRHSRRVTTENHLVSMPFHWSPKFEFLMKETELSICTYCSNQKKLLMGLDFDMW